MDGEQLPEIEPSQEASELLARMAQQHEQAKSYIESETGLILAYWKGLKVGEEDGLPADVAESALACWYGNYCGTRAQQVAFAAMHNIVAARVREEDEEEEDE